MQDRGAIGGTAASMAACALAVVSVACKVNIARAACGLLIGWDRLRER